MPPCPAALPAPLPYLSAPHAPHRSAPLPSAWRRQRRRPLLVGEGAARGPLPPARAAAAEPLRAASPGRCCGPAPRGSAQRGSAGPPRPPPPPASPGRGLLHGHRRPPGPPVGRFTAELAGCPVGTKPSLRALPALARGLPDAPPERERPSRLLAAPQGEGRWPPVPRVGGYTLKRHGEAWAAKAGGREKRQEAAAAFHIPSR